MLTRLLNTDLRTFRHFREVVGNLRKSQGFQSSSGYNITAARHPPPPLGICRAFVIFSSLRASSPVVGVLRKNVRGDATAKGGERKLSLSSAACSRVPSLLTSFAIIEELARRVFFSKICNAVRWGRTVQRKTHLRTTPLLMPSLYLYCMSFNFVGRRA